MAGLKMTRRSAEAAKATSIPPNCIYICFTGTRDSWKIRMKCVRWPTPTPIASR